MHPLQMFLDESLNISNTHIFDNKTLSLLFVNAVKMLFAVKVIFVSWILSDIAKTQIGERCKFWLLNEHLTAALDLQLFCWAAAKFGSSYGSMMDGRRGCWTLTLDGMPLMCCGFVKFGGWCCCLRCCSLGCSLDHIFPPVNMQMHPKPPVMFMLWRRAAGTLIKLKENCLFKIKYKIFGCPQRHLEATTVNKTTYLPPSWLC